MRSGSDRSCPLSINQANRCVRPCGARQTLTEECTLRMRTHLETHVALAHTHEQRRVHIRYSSRTPCSVEYTQHIGPAPTRVTIAFTRRQTVAVLKCRKSKIGRANMCANIGATRDPRSGTLSAVAAQMLSDTRFGCARPRAQSPHLGLTLPPRVGRMHLRHATPSGREIRGSENRSAARIGRRTCRAADPSTYPPV